MRAVLSGIVILLCCVKFQPIKSMETAKRWLDIACYHCTPASANPRTWFNNNLHTVQEGACYRAKTVSAAALEQIIIQKNIKTVLNVREDYGYWFELEKAVTKKLGVALRTIHLDGHKLPTNQQLNDIYQIFACGEGPILIHCQAGADRTGFVAAFWKLCKENKELAVAHAEQVASKGHLEWRFPLMRKCTEILHRIKTDLDKKNPLNDWSGVLAQYNESLELEQIRHTIPSAPVRAFHALRHTTVNAVKEHPKTAIAFVALAAAVAAAGYAHKKGKLKPALQAVKKKLF